MVKQVLALMTLWCAAPVGLWAQKADVAFVAGASFTSDSNVKPVCTTFPCFIPVDPLPPVHADHRVFLEGAFGVRLLDARLASVHVELPIAGIPSQALRFGQGSPFDHLSSVYVTPAVKMKFFPVGNLSPWGSIGGGFAHFSSDSHISTNKGAIQFGGGVDIKTSVPLLGLRAEARDFLTGDPRFATVTGQSGLHRHNVLVGGGILLRF